MDNKKYFKTVWDELNYELKLKELPVHQEMNQRMVNQGLVYVILSFLFLFYFTISAMEKSYTSEIKNLKKEVAQLHENINASNQITQESLSKIIVEVITNKEVLSEFQQWMTAPPKKGTVELPEVFRLSLAPYPIFTPITD